MYFVNLSFYSTHLLFSVFHISIFHYYYINLFKESGQCFKIIILFKTAHNLLFVKRETASIIPNNKKTMTMNSNEIF